VLSALNYTLGLAWIALRNTEFLAHLVISFKQLEHVTLALSVSRTFAVKCCKDMGSCAKASVHLQPFSR